MKADVRPTVQADVDEFLGRPLPYRAQAFTGRVDGEIKGIGGIAYLPDGTAVAFLHLAKDANRYAITLHKTARAIIAEAKKRGIRKLTAQADPAQPTAERWLARLGFEPVAIDGERVWIWQS